MMAPSLAVSRLLRSASKRASRMPREPHDIGEKAATVLRYSAASIRHSAEIRGSREPARER
jgi:hypothetical protein